MPATPWAPVVFSLALAIIPGSDNVLILGNKTMRERLGLTFGQIWGTIILGLKSAALRDLGQNAQVLAKEVACHGYDGDGRIWKRVNCRYEEEGLLWGASAFCRRLPKGFERRVTIFMTS